jgi:murein DD-endopeptidase MepM/ murein hydrolase activator NlpD
MAFIYGKVWACTYNYSIENTYNEGKGTPCFGRVMIIRSTREEKLYLLAHLDGYRMEVGADVIPGDIVAIAGNTGFSTGPHLHLEVHDCSGLEKEGILASTGNKKHPRDDPVNGEAGGLTWTINYWNAINSHRLNPFKHDEKFGTDWRK